MSTLIDKITTDPIRHWQRFIKGFAIFMVGVALWYSELALYYIGIDSLGLSESFMGSYGNSAKIIALVFILIGSLMSIYGYLQILVCRLLPAKVAKQNS
ncbi:hypothetical protein ISG33_13495 [Glaciecola sp. MH2013]|uniref:hypothetical protein n=1 Tax=Glaciecola sp. MH2013 TaxID=2785524 RepID=UPI00189F0296|nr:hypothetical protein [Glaciecola sp. MH2013]MBF7074415.1 hypothetical protein [Glaciecola sp. MH2013]